MRSIVVIILALCCAALPAEAQLSTYYKGWVREGGKQTPAT